MKDPVMSNNAFVKSGEMKLRAKMGDRPGAPAEMMKFNAYMSNDGASAEESCRKLTASMEDAFPVK
jgi:hypothetical protein